MKTAVLLIAAVSFAADPQSFESRKTRVRELLDIRDHAAALEQSKAINKEWPDDVKTYQLMAAAHLGLGAYEAAEADIQWMLDLRIGKADPEGWAVVARFREVTGDTEGALDAIIQAYRELKPEQRDLNQRLLAHSAHLYVLSGKTELAEKAVQAASRDVAPGSEVLTALAELRMAQGRRAEAIQTLRMLVALRPHPRNLYLLARGTHDPADYSAFVRSARERISQSDNANPELAVYLAGRGKSAEALTIAREEYARRKDVVTSAALATVLFASGQKAEGQKLMKRTLALGTRDPEILASAARMGVRPR